MQNKRLLVIVGSVLATIVIALLVIPSFIDWSKYQSIAQEKLRASTGYDLKIGGAFRMAILPSPHASAGNVIVSKPGKNDVFITLDNADVRLAFFPLLVGKIQVASITLDKPVVNLVDYKDGSDNWKPVSTQTNTTPQTPAAAAPKDEDGAPIAINGLRVKDGKVILRDETSGKAQTIGIKDLSVKADTLSGPFDGDGKISYNEAMFDISVTTGGYRRGETLPVQLEVKDADGRAELKWSGVVATGEPKELQGEMAAAFSDLPGLLADAGIPASIPPIGGKTQLSGMLTLNPDKLSLTNGNLQIGNTKFAARVDAQGLKTDSKTIAATFSTADVLDVDTLMEVADQTVEENKKAEEKAEKKTAPAKSSVQPFLPENFSLPTDLKADVTLRAKGLRYEKKETGAFEGRVTIAGGKGDLHITVDNIPGGGDISVAGSLADKAGLDGTLIASIDSVKTVLVDWLDVVDAKTLNNPGMPRRIDADVGFKVAGYNATATFKPLSLGETKLNGTLTYTRASRPIVTAKLDGNVFTLPGAKAEASKGEEKSTNEKAGETPKASDFKFDAPQLPFDLKFDVNLGRLVKGDLVMSDVKAAGTYDNKSLTLTSGGASLNGGALSATGRIADLKDMSGIDGQAGLTTSDLESFVLAMTGKPLTFKQKIGAFSGTAKVKGDRKQMAVDANAQARGYMISASGTLDDPFAPDLPGTMNIRIRHNNFVEAVRVFSPGFGSGTGGGGIDIGGTAKISGKVYEFADMKGMIGGSDIAGAVKADLSGAVPSVSANIVSKKLDVGSLVGVNSKSPSAGGNSAVGGGESGPTSMGSHWSREPLDTGFMKSIALDLKIDAQTLTYGTWVLNDAKAGVDLKNGALKVAPLSGGLYGGSLDANLSAQTVGDKSPLALNFKGDVNDVAIGPFLQALTSSSKKKADGTGSLNFEIKGSGTSAASLVASLAGSANVKTKTLTVYGIDLDKLAANMVEAFDGGWKGVLAGVTTQGFAGGNTAFKDVDHTFPIAAGDMTIDKFRMETTSSNAILLANGAVSFGRWYMDINSTVQVTQPKDVPVIGLRLYGPLDSPQKSVNSQAIDNLIRGKVGDKVQDLVNDKLKGTKAGEAINQFLPGLLGKESAPAPATPEPAAQPEAVPAAPAPEPEPEPEQKSPEQQLFEGVLDKLSQ